MSIINGVSGFMGKSGGGSWDIYALKYDNKTLDTIPQSTYNPMGLYLRNNGLSLYVNKYNIIYQYNLSTPWDISTGGYSGKSFNHGQANGKGIYIKSDGASLYVCGYTDNKVYQYTLSTPWDISTAVFTNKTLTAPDWTHGVFFKTDGTKMYVFKNNTGYQYTLSTPWDISTAVTDNKTLYFDGTLQGVTFSSDGKYFVYSNDTPNTYRYTLSTPWDISTAGNTITKAIGYPIAFCVNAEGTFFLYANDSMICQYSTT